MLFCSALRIVMRLAAGVSLFSSAGGGGGG